MDDNRDQIAAKLADVRAYYGTELYVHFVELLGMIDRSYDEDLRTVSPENLRHKQGAAKQVRLLRSTLVSKEDTGDIPRV